MKYFDESVKTQKDHIYIDIYAVRDDAKNVYHCFDDIQPLGAELSRARIATSQSIEKAKELLDNLEELQRYLTEFETK